MMGSAKGAIGDSMSRFHEEFFKNGSPEHDKLMIRCLSSAGVKKVCDEIDTYSEILRVYGNKETVMLCSIGNNGERSAHNTTTEQCISKSYDDKMHCRLRFSDYREACEYARERRCQLIENGALPIDKEVSKKISISEIEISKETEVIIKNGSFILGYADALINLVYKGSVDFEIEPKWTWKNAQEINRKIRILIEAKPKVTSIGEVIRQLKTYRDIIEANDRHSGEGNRIYSVIVTYSVLNEDELEYLKNENISVVTFEQV